MKIQITFDSLEEMQTYLRLPAPETGDEGCDIEPPAGPQVRVKGPVRQPESHRDAMYQASYETPPARPGGAPPAGGALSSDTAQAAAAITAAAQTRPGIVTDPPRLNVTAAADFGTPPPVDESYRLSVRRELADLNKLAGANLAKELIPEIAGVARLTDVPLDKLEALMAAAKAKKAALNGGAN